MYIYIHTLVYVTLWIYPVILLLFTDSPEEGDIRLINRGGYKSNGPLNVFVSGKWGTVAADSWNVVNTRVVCQQLGFLANGELTLSSLPNYLVALPSQVNDFVLPVE